VLRPRVILGQHRFGALRKAKGAGLALRSPACLRLPRHLETALSEAAKTAGSVIERKGSLLSVVIGPSSAAYAESLRGAVNYETQVTWNEPSQTATDRLGRWFCIGSFSVPAVFYGYGDRFWRGVWRVSHLHQENASRQSL